MSFCVFFLRQQQRIISSRVLNLRKLCSSTFHNTEREALAATELDLFLKHNCESGEIDTSHAQYFFNYMLSTKASNIRHLGKLFSGLVKAKHFSLAVSFFNRLDDAGVDGLRTINTTPLYLLVKELCLDEKVIEAHDLFSKMIKLGCYLDDPSTYATLIDGLCKERHVELVEQLFLAMQRQCYFGDLIPYNILIDGYCKAGMCEKAFDLLCEMEASGCSPDITTYNSLIGGYCEAGMCEDAFDLLLDMEDDGCCPNIITFNALIGGFARQKDGGRVEKLLQKMQAMNISPNSNTESILLENCQSLMKLLPSVS